MRLLTYGEGQLVVAGLFAVGLFVEMHDFVTSGSLLGVVACTAGGWICTNEFFHDRNGRGDSEDWDEDDL